MKFHVGVTADLRAIGEETGSNVGLALLETSDELEYGWIPDDEELGRRAIASCDGLLIFKPKLTEDTLFDSERLSIVARWGVGYDNVDLDALTRRGILCTNTPAAVRRPLAVAYLAMILALATNLSKKHQLVQLGHWSQTAHLGSGLSGKTLGVIGLGNIGRELFRLAEPLEMKHLAYDPFVNSSSESPGVEMVALQTLLTKSDYVCVCCPLTSDTYHLLGAPELGSMKPTACLINAARGSIVDESALIDLLWANELRGAALDVFEEEPLPMESPLRKLENVLLFSHSLGWTDELLNSNGVMACQSILERAHGRIPENLVNPEALQHPRNQHLVPSFGPRTQV